MKKLKLSVMFIMVLIATAIYILSLFNIGIPDKSSVFIVIVLGVFQAISAVDAYREKDKKVCMISCVGTFMCILLSITLMLKQY